MVFWTLSTWILTPVLIKIFGFSGVSIASALIACSLVIVVYLVKRQISFELFKSTIMPLISACIMGVIIYIISPIVVNGLLSLLFMIVTGAVIYFLTMLLLARKEVVSDAKLVLAQLKK